MRQGCFILDLPRKWGPAPAGLGRCLSHFRGKVGVSTRIGTGRVQPEPVPVEHPKVGMKQPWGMRRFSLKLVLSWMWAFAPVAMADGPADDLLKLVPADSGLTLAVEDLRDHAREVGESPLIQNLRRLPAVQTWLASERFRKFERAGRDVRAALGVSIGQVRDEVLGDAVILALKPGPVDKPDQARGLLLARPRDRALVESMLKRLNDAQIKSGELVGVDGKTSGPVRYAVRQFKPGLRPNEYYVHLDGGAFAWSNSEEMILGVIDRKTKGEPGLGDDPEFRKVRRGLPERPLASLFVNPRLLERAMADSPRSGQPAQDRVAAMMVRYVAAVARAGVALEWRDGFVLHSHEVIVPDKLDPWLKRWLTRPPSPVSLPDQLPSSAIAVVSSNLDFEAFREAARELTPDDVRPSLDNIRLGLQGILLGRDPVTEVLPRLGPGTLLYLDVEPKRGVRPHFSLVGVVGWSDPPGADDLAAPIDNALRTAFAFYALDPKRATAHLRVQDQAIGDVRLTELTDGLKVWLAYRADRNRLVVGNSPDAVARFATGQPPSTLSAVRSKYFPEAETFAIVDIERLSQEIGALQGPIARGLAARSKRPVASVDRDLALVLTVARLFQAATFTSTASRDASEIHRTLGLIAR